MLACSVEEAPTMDSLTAQFFTPSEISQLLVHCRTLGRRLGQHTGAMVTMGIYGGLWWVLVSCASTRNSALDVLLSA